MDRLIEPSFVCERPTQAAFCVSGQLPKAQTGGTQRRHQRRAHCDENSGAPVGVSDMKAGAPVARNSRRSATG
jgi:hypothetical protein